jgi:ParB family chromosome partitioning protein
VTLGGAEEPSATSRAPRSAREPHPRASEIAGQLADRLDTRVKVDSGRSKGRLTIEFASPEDLERIADVLLR